MNILRSAQLSSTVKHCYGYEIKNKKIGKDKNVNIFCVGKLNVLFWINEGKSFKMKREWFEILSNNCDQYALLLFDKKGKKYYYIKFRNKNNWISGSFNNCDKNELFLGKQILNYPSTIAQVITDIQKHSM